MKQANFQKILVANRGEIALRVVKAIRSLDKLAVVVHSEFDSRLPFVTEADEAYSLGTGLLSDTYLDTRKIMEIARIARVDAIHPGYGFLSENPGFASACRKQGVVFIGPDPDVIRLMGNKSHAREKAKELGIPVLEGTTGRLEELIGMKDRLPYPLLIKPSAGGGGKGMRIIHSSADFEGEARDASREAMNYFGDGTLYVERYLEHSRHIEVQVMADHHGRSVHLFERECTLQRRYQKIIEEAPSAYLSENTREEITQSALDLADGIGYTNAGTVEFLVGPDQGYYFLEMNTRIQVEHPVTEMITGVDLVREQIRISEGHPLSFTQDSLPIHGHAIEARIYAEDPGKEFMPASGRIDIFEVPARSGVRVDSGFRGGNLVEPYYDPMLAKVIAQGSTREDAGNLLLGALKDFRITGLTTNRDFLIGLLRSDLFRKHKVHTRLIDVELPSLLKYQDQARASLPEDLLLCAAALIALQNLDPGGTPGSPWQVIGHWRILPEITLLLNHREFRIRYELQKGRRRMNLHLEEKVYLVGLEHQDHHDYWIRIDDHLIKVWGITDRSDIHLDADGHFFRLRRTDILDRRYIRTPGDQSREGPGELFAPLHGRVVQINVKQDDEVEAGDPLLVIESMKMENKILSGHRASVREVHVSVGDLVQSNQLIITLASL